MTHLKIAVIGGGAAGFFAAISCKKHHPTAQVTLYEKSNKLLAKVKVSGGGRCNVTNASFQNAQLAKNYPRGEKQLKKAFQVFNAADTVEWFESRGVQLKSEPDGRMFPISDDSQTIIDCLVNEARKLQIEILKSSTVEEIDSDGDGFKLRFNNNTHANINKVIVATGGSPKPSGFEWLKMLGHEIIPPVPSLFTFNIPGKPIRELMGVVVDPVMVKVQSTKLQSHGPLLITHWGMSGPAILKLSAWGARALNEKGYQFTIQINWVAMNEDQLRERFMQEIERIKKRKIGNSNFFGFPSRFWTFLLQKATIDPDMVWLDLAKKNLNRLINTLLNDEYTVSGKTTFKEEFVTCGGVALSDIRMETMESKKCPGMYFAGEVLDIDGITGGFNFQAAWTTGFIAGKLL